MGKSLYVQQGIFGMESELLYGYLRVAFQKLTAKSIRKHEYFSEVQRQSSR